MAGNASSLVAEVNKVNAVMAAFRENMAVAIKGNQKTFDEYQRSFANAMTATGQFTVHTSNAMSSTTKFGKALDENRFSLGQYTKMINEYRNAATRASSEIMKLADQQTRFASAKSHVIGTDEMGRAQIQTFIPTGVDPSQYMTRAAKATGIFTKALENQSQKLIDWGKNTQWAGRQLTVGLSVPLIAAAGVAVDLALKMEAELTSIQKVYDFTSQDMQGQTKEWAVVRDASLKVAGDAAQKYGARIADTLAIESQLAAAGKNMNNGLIETTQEVIRATALTFQNQKATLSDYMNVFNATISLQNIFKLSTKQTSDAFNYLNAVENATVLKMSDFIDAIPRSFGPLHTLGLSLQEIGTLLTAMKANGVSAAQGSNALKSAMVSLLNPTTAAVKAFKAVNIDVKDLVQSVGGNMFKALQRLSVLMKDMSPQTQESLLARLFGKYQTARIDAVVKGLRDVNDATTQVGRAYIVAQESSQKWGDMAAKQLARFAESPYQKLQRNIATLGAQFAKIGDALIPVVTWIVNAVENIVGAFNKLPSIIKSVIGVGLGGLAILGPATMLFGTLFGNAIGNVFKLAVRSWAMFRTRVLGHEIDMNNNLTPDSIAEKAASEAEMVSQAFYDQSKAARTLTSAVSDLIAKYEQLIRTAAGVGTKQEFLQVGAYGQLTDPSTTYGAKSGAKAFPVGVTGAYPGIRAPSGGYGRRAVNEAAIAQAAVMGGRGDSLAGGALTRSLSVESEARTYIAANTEVYNYFKAWEEKLKIATVAEWETIKQISPALKEVLLAIQNEGIKIKEGDFSHFVTGQSGRAGVGLGFLEEKGINRLRGERDIGSGELVSGAEKILADRMALDAAAIERATAAAESIAAITIASKAGVEDFGTVLGESAPLIRNEALKMVASLEAQVAKENAAAQLAFDERVAMTGISARALEAQGQLVLEFDEAIKKDTIATLAETAAKQESTGVIEGATAAVADSIPANSIGTGRARISGKRRMAGMGVAGGIMGLSMLTSQFQTSNAALGVGQDMLNSAGMGAGIGMMFGPEGAAIGAGVGAAAGGLIGVFSLLRKRSEELAVAQKKLLDTSSTTTGNNISVDALGFAGAKKVMTGQLGFSFGNQIDPFKQQTKDFIDGVKSNFAEQIASVKDATDAGATNIGKQIYSELLINGVPAASAKNIVAQIFREAGKQKLVIPVQTVLDKVTTTPQALNLLKAASQNQLETLAGLARKETSTIWQQGAPSGKGGPSMAKPRDIGTHITNQFATIIGNAGTVAGKQLFTELQASIEKQSPASVAAALSKKADEIFKMTFDSMGLKSLDDTSKKILANFGIDGSQSLDKVADSVLKLDNATRTKLYKSLNDTGDNAAANFVTGMKASEAASGNLIKQLDNLIPGLGDLVATLTAGSGGLSAMGAAAQALAGDLHQVGAAQELFNATVNSQIQAHVSGVIDAMRKRLAAQNDQSALQDRQQKAEQASADAIQAVTDAYEKQIQAITDAEAAKQKAFQAEQERLRRLQQLHNLQVNLAEDIAGGNLFAANRDANDITMIGKQNAATDAAAKSQAAADARIKVLKDEEKKKTDLMKKSADAQKKADAKALKDFQKNADARTAAEVAAEGVVTRAAQAAAANIMTAWNGVTPQLIALGKIWGVDLTTTLKTSLVNGLKDIPAIMMQSLTAAIGSADWSKLQLLLYGVMNLKDQSDIATFAKLVAAGKIPVISQGALIGVKGPTGGTQLFSGGGHVRGPGSTKSDSIPAWLSDEEYVIQASSVKKYGKGFFDKLNAGHFAGGGFVHGIADAFSKMALVDGINAWFNNNAKGSKARLSAAAATAVAAGAGGGAGHTVSGVGGFTPAMSQAILNMLHVTGTLAPRDSNWFNAWHRAEGGKASFNPFNTTQRMPGSTNYNSFGPGGKYHVQNYPNMNSGEVATFNTLNNGHYGKILSVLRNPSAGGTDFARAVGTSPWGTNGHLIAKILGVGYSGGGYIPSLRSGALRINYDNTLANLHKGERVLTAMNTNKLDAGLERFANGDVSGYNLTVKVEKANATAEDIADAMVRAIDKRESKLGRDRRVTS